MLLLGSVVNHANAGIGGGSPDPAPIVADAVSNSGNSRLFATNPFSSSSSYSCVLFSGWVYPNDLTNWQGIVTIGAGAATTIESIIQISNSGKLRFYRGTDGVQFYSSSSLTLNAWNHLMLSLEWGGRIVMILNDIVDTDTTVTGNNFSITTNDEAAISSRVAFNNIFDGDHAEIWYTHTNTYYDLTVEANRRKFISSDGKPMDLGADGSIPIGTQPMIYFSGDATEWNNGNNKGSLTGWSLNGSFSDASTEPVEL